MQSILIATDGSPAATAAVEFGIDLAAAQHARVAFLYVSPGAADGAKPATHGTDDLPTKDGVALAAAQRTAAQRGVESRIDIVMGCPADEIVAYADTIDADLIVVGSHRDDRSENPELGGVPHGVLHEASQPLLVVRTPRARPHPKA